MERYNRFSELLWLIITIVTTCMVIYMMIDEGSIQKSKWYLFIPLLAGAMYFMRRALRIRFAKNKEEYEAISKKKQS